MLINPSLIVPRLHTTLEHLLQASNQAFYLGRACPSTYHLIMQMGNRLFLCIDNLGQIIKELEPGKINTGSLTSEEDLVLDSYQEIERGLILSWEFIQERKRAIFQQAANRQAVGQ